MEFQPRQKSAEPTVSYANQTSPDQISKARAVWKVKKTSAEIQNLKKSCAEHTRRVVSLSEELLYCANKHIELNAARDAEIAQALKEIETRYDNLHADIQQYDKLAENEKGREEGRKARGRKARGRKARGRKQEGQASRW
jgi:hypothetical protein